MEETNMNNWDRDNLNFILNTTDEAFSDWMLQADSDDIDYALELITKHREEIYLKEYLLKLNIDFDRIQKTIENVSSLIDKKQTYINILSE